MFIYNHIFSYQMSLSMEDFTWKCMHDFVSGRFYLEVHACLCQGKILVGVHACLCQ